MQVTPIPTAEETNAEVLLWQGRYRLVFLPVIGFSTVTLKWFGVIAADSLYSTAYGVRPLLLMVIGLLVGYVVLQKLMMAYVRRRRRAGIGLVVAINAADLIALFVTLALLTPPEYFERTLLVSVFTLLLTQIFFDWTATVANLALIAIGYTGLVALAADAGGGRVNPVEELWSLALFGVGVLIYVLMLGHVAGRMRSLVQIFSRAQEGDFSARYEEEAGQMPDPVTVIGRAYNRMRMHLETIVLTDPLSGCYNRRGLNQLAEREVARAIRSKTELAVLAIDVDHFGRINDEYGRLTGDEVIREAGALLKETAREADVVARVGREEFTIIVPDTTEEGALILAERVMEGFRTHRFRSLPPNTQITTSVGVAADVARDDEVAKTLLARADEALYVAKRNGRDRSVLWHAGMRAFDGTLAGRAGPP